MIREFVPCGVFVLGCFFLGSVQPVYGAEGVAPPAAYPADSWQGWSKATLRILDRLESRITVMTLSIGEEGHYRSLSLKLLACVQRPQTLAPEVAARLHLEDSKAKSSTPFEGWFLANLPSLSLYQNPLYDVHIVQCDGQKVPPMMGALPSVTIPQITTSMPERLDADGQSVQLQGNLPVGGAPTSLVPQEYNQPVNSPDPRLMGAPPAGSSEKPLPPPTPLLP